MRVVSTIMSPSFGGSIEAVDVLIVHLMLDITHTNTEQFEIKRSMKKGGIKKAILGGPRIALSKGLCGPCISKEYFCYYVK